MMRPSPFAPLLGAALAAGILVAAGLAFRAGASSDDIFIELEDISPSISQQTNSVSMAEPIPPASESVDAADARASDPDGEERSADTLAPQPALAIVIDDVGLDRAAFDAALAIDAPLTFAILPYAPAAPEFAREAAAAGREVFLHMPMEPRGLADPGPRALTKALSPADVSNRTAWALRRVPGAVGVNNHMGSRLTADREAVGTALAPLQGRGLVFLDSMTSPDSVAADAASALGMPALRRDVFLDNDRSPDAVSAALDAAFEQARKQGRAVAIGHPRPETLAVLAEAEARAEAAGVRLTTVSALAGVEDI